MTVKSEKILHLIFFWSLLLKGLNAIVEIILGSAFFAGVKLFGWLQLLAKQELLEDPKDFIVPYLQHYLTNISHDTRVFFAYYLLSHGIIKLFLVIGLLRKKLWMYPIAIVVFILFIVYQAYRYIFTHSIFLIVLTAFDIFFIWLTWHEYRYYRKKYSMRKRNETGR